MGKMFAFLSSTASLVTIGLFLLGLVGLSGAVIVLSMVGRDLRAFPRLESWFFVLARVYLIFLAFLVLMTLALLVLP
jgi:hypothetical protein